MGYVGNQSTNAYSSLPAKQDLTGATGTSLTLSHAVAGPESIDLFINNVRQEPTTAYSVSDTTVTLTGSVVASDDIYVVYNGLALQTIVPPDASVTSAKIADDAVTSAKIADDAVTSAKLDTNIAVAGNLTVDGDALGTDFVMTFNPSLPPSGTGTYYQNGALTSTDGSLINTLVPCDFKIKELKVYVNSALSSGSATVAIVKDGSTTGNLSIGTGTNVHSLTSFLANNSFM